MQTRKTFTGKLQGHQDDTAVALQIALLSSKIFYQEDRWLCTKLPLIYSPIVDVFVFDNVGRYATYRLHDWGCDWNKRLRIT